METWANKRKASYTGRWFQIMSVTAVTVSFASPDILIKHKRKSSGQTQVNHQNTIQTQNPNFRCRKKDVFRCILKVELNTLEKLHCFLGCEEKKPHC